MGMKGVDVVYRGVCFGPLGTKMLLFKETFAVIAIYKNLRYRNV